MTNPNPNLNPEHGIARERPSTAASNEIRCYDCDNEYAYIGDGPHPGVCPACGSLGVSPAGDLQVMDIQSVSHVDEADIDRFYRIRCLDESAQDGNRVFDYHVELSGDQLVLMDVTAEEVTVPAADLVATPMVPLGLLRETVAEEIDDDVELTVGGASA
jgi:ribosomal protein S27E